MYDDTSMHGMNSNGIFIHYEKRLYGVKLSDLMKLPLGERFIFKPFEWGFEMQPISWKGVKWMPYFHRDKEFATCWLVEFSNNPSWPGKYAMFIDNDMGYKIRNPNYQKEVAA